MVIGSKGEDLTTKSLFQKTCEVSGRLHRCNFSPTNKSSNKSHIQRRIDRDDLEATGRYIYNFESAREDTTFFDPDYC